MTTCLRRGLPPDRDDRTASTPGPRQNEVSSVSAATELGPLAVFVTARWVAPDEMGVIESVRGVLWARKRQPDEVAYGVALGHERFSPAQPKP